MAELPSGTVTFLFTDIEGSTARWEQQPEAMRLALARHDALVRDAIARHGGSVVKTMGDAFHTAFSRAQDAVEAALDAQRRLMAEPWGTIEPIRVRMALHTGEAEERDGDYYGPSLNRAARLLSTGHGGQVLLSEVAAGLVRDSLPKSCHLLDLGQHRLKDLIEPERVFQLESPDLASDFPPLASLDAHPNNLPTHPTTVLGRERELADVRGLFDDGARLVTLTGPGGTGKTRLGLQVAAELVDRFQHGVFLVELAPVWDPTLVPSTVGQALGLRDVVSRPMIEVLKEYLRGRSILLLLDNFEQILPAASIVADLLAASPRLNVLVTSREPLRLRGEQEYAVLPLALPDTRRATTLAVASLSPAVALFVQRARAIRADFTLTDENAPAVAEICHRLDGLPLAIELAAARIKLLPPLALLNRLERRLAVLTGGARDLPTRQRTLRDAIAWSYDLLTEPERRAFRRMAIFVGGCTVEAAQALCDPDGDLDVDVLDAVASLVDKSLLRQIDGPDGEPRFAMLETIREYGLEQLQASGEEEDVRWLHAGYFVVLAEEADAHSERAEAGVWFDRLQADHDNLRAALTWSQGAEDREAIFGRLCGALWRFWWMRGYTSEARGWLDRALALPAEPAVRAQQLQGAANLAFFQDNYPRARELWTALIDHGRATDRPTDAALAMARLAYVMRNMGNFEQALTLAEESLALSRRLGDTVSVAHSLHNCAIVALGRGDLDRAQVAWEEALGLFRENGMAFMVAHVVNNLGNIARMRGDLDTASALCEEALGLFRQRDDRFGLQPCLMSLLRIAHVRGDAVRMRSLGRELLPLSLDQGSVVYLAGPLELLAWAIRVDGDPARAANLLAAAAQFREAAGALATGPERDRVEAEIVQMRSLLGDEAFVAAWAAGRAMAREKAVAYALDEPPPP